jgi:alpha-beta hydrolase superfamily lysophospholipase
MDLLYEFRHPTRWYSKLVAVSLALVFFTFLAGGIIAGFVIYRIVTPTKTSESINLANFPGHPQVVSYPVSGQGMSDGWFFPGLKSAPTILLCAGYHTSRGELLPLAIALQDHEYNVFLFDFDRHSSKTPNSTLGFRETEEVKAALAVLARRDDVDRSRFGLWGTNMGAYAALALAESDPRVRAVVVESVFDRPQDMVRLLVARYGLAPLPLLTGMVEKGFLWLNYSYRQTPPLSAGLSRLVGVPKLFLTAPDEGALMVSTRQLFVQAPEPKEQVLLPHGDYAGMLDEEKHEYENRIVAFFLLNLPTAANLQP